jgi:S-adenosylmethionine synthetase
MLFTSESVTEGHPDKVADQISDAVLDAVLAVDPAARVACETLVTRDLIMLAGEISANGAVDYEQVARETVRRIGYTDPGLGFHDGCEVQVRLVEQSPDIARGVDWALEVRERARQVRPAAALGAGDQGMMFGYATDETPELMPAPIALAHRLARRLAEVRRKRVLAWLRPDGKTQATIHYENGVPRRVEHVLVSAQHDDDVREGEVRDGIIEEVVRPVLATTSLETAGVLDRLLVNPTGRFVLGGPAYDCGLTGRKIMVDTYGGMARHGGGAFSGKDPSKVDRSGAYAARWVAKNLVAAGLAARCEVQLAYAIGVARPVSMLIETFGTETLKRELIERIVDQHFDLRPGAIRETLALQRPIYAPTAAYGHFGREEPSFAWEDTGRAALLKAAGTITRPR